MGMPHDPIITTLDAYVKYSVGKCGYYSFGKKLSYEEEPVCLLEEIK
jgi:hypothetical protein